MDWFRKAVSYVRRRGETQLETTSNPPPPCLDPKEYRLRLRAEVIKEGYRPTKMVVIQGRKPVEVTFCNKFVRAVSRWFGTGMMFEKPDTNQAGEMVMYMRMHPQEWSVIGDWERARDLALSGRLLIAGDVNREMNPLLAWSPSGHVCVLAPESEMIRSNKWKRWCPQTANVGDLSSMGYGKGLNWAFSRPPDIFLLERVIMQSSDAA